MHEYIQKIVDELERDYEPSEWVESILKEMQNIAIRETDAKWQAKLEELQKQLNEYMFVAETIDEMYVKEVQKSDELQKRVEWLEDRLKATDALSKMRAAVIGSFNSQEFNARTRRKMMILKRAEQALKGEG
ncbi:hypothetical protein [Acinetobacter baumannii]|uniref:hypothetical protein n=1 Tax=Acinetobacter baumannii TaxID=470 RepID=UPI002244D043|nr:hypothetical protein [Acinetobacter baumannii]MCW8533594.1 hypothetical protein [Acinetobacter baumannii]MCW8537363.1 hypothetical protein [Acinetobacter baumannii]MCW8544794.1 hypothetical protein [Acinetobacter baumannii]MCW8548562.1 hypothetical protein [Acinetobacter baumannii]MCW8559409.1 hypothetical protein [Acinetobacter baumannii]